VKEWKGKNTNKGIKKYENVISLQNKIQDFTNLKKKGIPP
jgi:hypothetical protein